MPLTNHCPTYQRLLHLTVPQALRWSGRLFPQPFKLFLNRLLATWRDNASDIRSHTLDKKCCTRCFLA